MTNNDLHLVKQMVVAGVEDKILDLVTLSREEKVRQLIEKMGNKYRLHPDNFIKKVANE